MGFNKICISAGHTPSGTAGCGAVGRLDESKCTREIAPLVEKYLKQGGATTNLQIINKGNSYNCEDCYVRAQNSNNWGSDFYVEVHLNAGGGVGCEVEVSGFGGKAEEVAHRVSANISNAIGIPNRGVKQMNLIVLNKTSCPAILVECLFCDSSDTDKYNPDKIAKAIAEGILNIQINAPQPVAPQPANQPEIKYMGHVENIGWQAWVDSNTDGFVGTTGKSLRLEALVAELVGISGNIDIQGHVENIGWQAMRYEGEVVGTMGQGLRLEAIKIHLDGVSGYKVQYRAHVQDVGWMNWVEDGEIAGTTGQCKRLEAFQIRLVKA